MTRLFAFFLSSVPAVVTAAPLLDSKFDEKFTHLVFAGTSGDLTIRGVEGAARVKAERKAGDDDCKITARVDGDTLRVETNSEHVRRCRIDVELSVPKKMDLDIAIGSGDVGIRDINGPLSFRSGSGDLAVTAELTQVEIKTGSGSVALSGVQGSVDVMTGSGDVAGRIAGFPEDGHVNVRTGSGDVALTFESVPQKGKIDVRTGSGDVVSKVPQDARVRVEFMSGSGSVRDSLGRSEDAKLVMKVRTGSGDLVLAPR